MQRLLFAVAIFALFTTFALAETATGKIQKVDAGKGTISFRDSTDKVHAAKVDKDTKILDADGKELKDGLSNAAFKEGAEVSVTTDGKGKKAMTKEVKLVKKAG